MSQTIDPLFKQENRVYTYAYDKCTGDVISFDCTYRELDETVVGRNKHGRLFRMQISPNQGEIFYFVDAMWYVVWFKEPNRDKAIAAFANYILNQIGIEVKTHQSFIDRINRDKLELIKKLENLPED